MKEIAFPEAIERARSRLQAHYAICTAFMALGMMLPGMAAGWLQELIGYKHFFYWVMICCAATIAVCAFIKIDPNYGKKETEEKETETK